jgi:MFS transporter, SP family, sugar:H+ symporter
MKGLSLSTKIHFDKYNPHLEDATDTRNSLAHLDYSPLPRVTGRSLSMGVLISMGGFM